MGLIEVYGSTVIIPLFYEHGSDGFAVSNIVSCFPVVQWNLVNTVNNGPKKSGSINGVAVSMTVFFFLQENV